MATWEDGPEYAPHEPPAHFDAPALEPLSQAPPRTRPSAGAPRQLPQDFTAPPAAPLATIGANTGGHRNPQLPFDVRTGALTHGTSAWSAAHSLQNAEPADHQWAPPTGNPVVATALAPGHQDPLRPIVVGNAIETPPSSTWAPPSPVGAPEPPSPVNGLAPPSPVNAAAPPTPPTANAPMWRRVTDLLTWPLVASLALGLIPPISPVMLIVSTVFAWRLDDALRSVRIAITAALSYTALIALLALLSNSWWSTTSTWAWGVTIFAALYAVVMAYLVASGKVRPSNQPPNSP